jgi:hypothetical protein
MFAEGQCQGSLTRLALSSSEKRDQPADVRTKPGMAVSIPKNLRFLLSATWGMQCD